MPKRLSSRVIPTTDTLWVTYAALLLQRRIRGSPTRLTTSNMNGSALPIVLDYRGLSFMAYARQQRAILLPASAICSVTAARMGDERHIVGLVGKLLNASDELSSSAAITSETFKAIVTGEPVEGRDVYKSRIEFRPIAQHIFATNTLPPFQGGMDRGV